MPTRVFTGRLDETPFNGDRIGENAAFYACRDSQNATQSRDLGFGSREPSWDQADVPAILKQDLSKFAGDSRLKVEYSLHFKITGNQGANLQSTPTMWVWIDTTKSKYLAKFLGSRGRCDVTTERYNVDTTLTTADKLYGWCGPNGPCPFDGYPTRITVGVNNQGGTAGYLCYPADGVTIYIELNITVSIECSGVLLEDDACSSYCLESKNTDECYQVMLDYCIPPDASTFRMQNIVCDTFFSNMLARKGPDRGLDVRLRAYCQRKFSGFKDLLETGTDSEKKACACNMPDIQYEALYEQVSEDYNIPRGLLGNSRCLFPKCNDGGYKTTEIGQTCPTPVCLNVATFTNTGTFTDSTIQITQVGDCASIQKKPSPDPTPTPDPTPATDSVESSTGRSRLLLLLFLVAIVVLILGIVLVYTG